MGRFLLCFAIALVACEPSGSSLTLQLRSDLVPGTEVVMIDLTQGGAVVHHTTVPLAGAALARGVRLLSDFPLTPGLVVAHVALTRGGTTVQERDARVRVDGATVATVLMLRECNGVTCPAATDDPGDLACLGGRCVPPDCVEEHPELCPRPECTPTSSCARSPIACVDVTCTATGTCFEIGDDERCGPGGTCSTQSGCSSPPLDASVDASADAAPGDAGLLPAPVVTSPFVGQATGSSTIALDAIIVEHPLRPTIRWRPVAGALGYVVLLDDSCDPVSFATCDFPSPAVDELTTDTLYLPPPLAVTPGSGTRYYVSVGACSTLDGPRTSCSFSEVRYFDVGHVRGDSTGDGIADLLIAEAAVAGGGRYDVLRLTGGTFAPAGILSVGPGVPELVLVGDVDRNGLDDFAFGFPDGTAAVALGAASGARVFHDATSGLASHVGAAGDLDGDGYADIAVGADDDGAGVVFIHYGGPGGPAEVGEVTVRSAVGATRFGFAMAGADLDSDGRSDLVVAGEVSEQPVLEVFLSSRGSRALPSTAMYTVPASTKGPFARLAGGGDFDGDGLSDVFATLAGSASAMVVSITGATARPMETLSYVVGYFGTSLGAGPLRGRREWSAIVGAPMRDGTGGMDSGGAVECRGILPHDVSFFLPYDCCGARSFTGSAVSIADFDGNGWVDVMLGAPGASRLEIFYSNDTGTSTMGAVPAPGGELEWGVALSY